MRPETLQCRLYLSAVLRRPLESPMWSKKKSDTTQTAGPEGTSLQTNQPPKPATASSEGTTKMNEDVTRPAGGTTDLGAVAARIEPAFERRNLGQRGSGHRRNG